MLSKEKKVQPTSKSGNDAKPIVIRSVCKCGNQLTEKELFYETCLQCGETPKQTDVQLVNRRKYIPSKCRFTNLNN